jgi:hypothetical protein
MPAAWAAAGAAGAGLLGGYMSGQAAESAAQTAADAQMRMARLAAQASAFRPIGMTTRFGTSNFNVEIDPKTKLPVLKSATYTASPELKALQDRLSAMYNQSLGQAEEARAISAPLGYAGQGLFGLGAQYLATSPAEARQQYVNEQMALLDPIRAREEQRLASSVFGRGRAGVNIGTQGQPELNALAEARRMQDLQLTAQAEQAAQQRIGFGAGLFGTGAQLIGNQYALQNQALSPFMTQFGLQQSLEQAALQPLQLGAELGGRAINTAGASALLQGGLAAGQTRLQGSLVGPTLMANTLSNFGQNYMQNQRQQQLFDFLRNRQDPTGGFNPNSYFMSSQASPFGGSPYDFGVEDWSAM